LNSFPASQGPLKSFLLNIRVTVHLFIGNLVEYLVLTVHKPVAKLAGCLTGPVQKVT